MTSDRQVVFGDTPGQVGTLHLRRPATLGWGYPMTFDEANCGEGVKPHKTDSGPDEQSFSFLNVRFYQLEYINGLVWATIYPTIQVNRLYDFINTIQHCVKYNLYHRCIIFVFEL